jgi:predicted secreted Zn-dependent protease
MASEAEARTQAARARDAAADALRSRNRLAARLVDAIDQAGPRAGVAEIASDPQVMRWARREGEDDTSFYRSGG